ncbi:hypothetical protein HHI36_014356 [Cryptolaemus montrouzieri]|uniref:Uncharacterized protein n=1 Tax=Cryptolaemus montrouzieri TaxID=559131 RepID=A0ABD2N2I3_9CUCU
MSDIVIISLYYLEAKEVTYTVNPEWYSSLMIDYLEAKQRRMFLNGRINKITAGIFPFRNCIEKIFLDILKERFSVSGLMVKGTLVEDHHLECIFELLRALFLFCDAGIFPFFSNFQRGKRKKS